ncbi:aminotransferase class I/II-fold pyridoxal phosphate-dependent enzyme [Streptomyces sp. NPDC048483]|uniref:aminotransferase class I/II-fold pyridoxal phosphate-dependent enzyme n=1 Tax=Streptomyces sp. NPDC048483 TaxID=3154927 RepID=UPI00344559DE
MTGYAYLVALLTLLYLGIPDARTPVWAAIGLLGVAAILTGVRIHRPAHRWPWWALAAGLFTFAAGDTVYNVLASYLGVVHPFPSLADACYLLTYPLFATGLFGLVHYRWSGRDVPNLLDALILTSGLSVLVWDFLVQPLTHVQGQPWTERAVSIAYPLGDVLVLALLTRLLVPSIRARRMRAVQLLVIGTATMLGFDIAYGILQLNGEWQAGPVLDTGWVVFYTAWGMAALHPSMVELTAHAPQGPSPVPPMRRLLLLSLTSLIAPALLLYEALHGAARDVAVIAAFSGVLFLLVIARLTGMVVAHRRAIDRERVLGAAAASLVTAVRPQEISRICGTAAAALFGPHTRCEIRLLAAEDMDAERQRAGPLARSESRLMSVGDLSPGIAAGLGHLPSVLVCPVIVPDRPAGGELLGILLAAGPTKPLAEMRRSLEILASHAGLAMERVGLSQEISRRDSEAYFRALVQQASDVILIVDDDDTIRYASPSGRSLFGDVRLTGTGLFALVDVRDRERARHAVQAIRSDEGEEDRDSWWLVRATGRIEAEVRFSDLRHDPTVHGLVITLRDVTEQRQLEQELTRRAFHDALTGLPNRTLLLERIGRALLRGERESTVTSVLFIDLDDFKVVNDTMGHTVGDQLLVAVAGRLSDSLRRSDTAARLGGDEFAVLMEDTKVVTNAESLATQVLQALSRPFRLADGSVTISASVGVATAMDSSGAEELLSHADLALYAAKAAGKRQWRRFQPGLHARMVERHEMQASLDAAIAEQAFALRYQPIVDITQGDVVGFEALVRWPHPRRGLVPPSKFIEFAEETGQITSLGAWVLEHAAASFTRWQETLEGSRPPPYVSVNVSARQLRDAGFLDEVSKVLETPRLAPGALLLELTETELMRGDDQVHAVLRTLKNLGVRIAIDDFGTGFSSLSYLREFPIDVLKIDKSFIDDILLGAQQVALVEGIVRIADTLGLEVIAEGIEDAAQRDLLAGMGCRFGQGYLFARPMTAEQGELLLRRRNGSRPPADIPAEQPPPGKAPTAGTRPPPRPATPAQLPGRQEVARYDTVAEPRGVRRDPRCGDLEHLRRTSPMSDAVLDEVRGRHLRSGDHWLIDFASCNYLGFDWDPEITEAIGPAVRNWGSHPSWSRLLGSPRLYPEIEEKLAALLHAPDTLVLPTVTLIHTSVIPVLAGEGHVFVEAEAHRTVYDGCTAARGQGATVQRFRADQPDRLDSLLRAVPNSSARLVCLDGVNSMSGKVPDLPELAAICRDRSATLYIDDTHGFGVLGERVPDEPCPYGSRGNGVVRHTGETYDDIVLVGGFSKAYSSHLAFLALPCWLKDHLKVAAAPYLYSGPSPTASLATALAGLAVNDARGDAIRAELHRKTRRVLDHAERLGLDTRNPGGFPILHIPLEDASDLDAVAAFLWENGIYVALAAYPLVPHNRVGFRIQITALNSDEDIERLNDTLTRLAERFALRARS